ncbi:GDP-D-glucose phosphorylase 1 [Trichosurus vulpecula]|uniref:GDP-D-glucose phosphorylase 1 n=1 Tax=Trichosurus vulpecula TaxID=9337 RepID=UPI00186AFD99|nr:GDP-D-glucose phosphorylase 1 [Trichosurus vulpecula]XP_036590617.1 GDP-D-glucose phosphorylase 1 [Trichosurus vulpecula]
MAVPQNINEISNLPPQSSGSDEQLRLPVGPGVLEFVYGSEELIVEGIQWQTSESGVLCPPLLSRFDRTLQSSWKQRMEQGLFRYCLGELQTQILPGPLGFVAQLNVERGVQRRCPQNVQSVRQAFDPQQFNFNKIHPREILFRLCRGPGFPKAFQFNEILVIINVSPLEWGHVLFVPEPTQGLPQILMQDPLQFGVEAVMLSTHPGFRVGFNSLGGLASVNHLHLHGYYLAHKLPVETAPSQPLDPKGHIHLLRGLPAPGFLFYVDEPGPKLEAVVDRVCLVTNYLIDQEIAHNLFVTRGAPPGTSPSSLAYTGVRVILWARKSSFGIKEGEAFNVALCELAGHLPVKTSQDFESLTEASALNLIRQSLLPSSQFLQLQEELVSLLA